MILWARHAASPRPASKLLHGSSPSIRTLTHFKIVQHTTPVQHTRHYPGGAEPGHHNDLLLSVKQYIPKSETGPSSNGLTIIGAHGNGLPSELLEPFWDDFYEHVRSKGQHIRSIWVADQAHQGQSGIFNEEILGNDPSWFDHARDLLYLINLKQKQMPQPLFGVGHSMGAAQLAYLAMLHPSLLQGLVLMDPVIQPTNPGRTSGIASTYRRDTWPSKQAARESFAKSKLYQAWDPRVFDKWIEAGLRELPTELCSDAAQIEGSAPVTLTTTKEQEVYSYLRPLWKGVPGTVPLEDHENYSDFDPEAVEPDFPFYRPEASILFRKLPELRPPTLYLTGKHSPLAGTELNRQRLELTGSGVGGSGGAKAGCVSVTEMDCGHFVPMDEPIKSSGFAADFIGVEAAKWQQKMQLFQQQWKKEPRPESVMLDDEWRQRIGPRAPR
ncbi:uncharacterized protein HMPREF1541_00190 [Cyphellophora europaea CBS 101466]|uniref:AB hydrolase-1 domain-containing protein n=1 Tax=Cyphellophora europaea (strain CBS 101466) TaxID=1220924 RepID=W2SBC9_CYPE1|nr:uncharacterized protein HMPREF1541_00190 [Cyphellophora europaea CBS 101466]ETN46007.1 hypothetical protein HMPREF1541_00190 [Cyphellophora europaea CBS 101466]